MILANNVGYVSLKRTAEDREGWRHRERMSKNLLQQKTTDNDDDDEGSNRDVLVRFSGPTAPWATAGGSYF